MTRDVYFLTNLGVEMKLSSKSTLIGTITLGVVIAASTMAFAGSHASSKDEQKDAMEYRQSTFKMVGQHFGMMAAMVKGKVEYDAAAFTKNAEAVQMLSQLSPNGFVAVGSAKKSRAKKAIWEEKEDFAQKVTDFQTASAALVEASKTGDLDKAKAAFGGVGKTCKGCHTDYRSKKK